MVIPKELDATITCLVNGRTVSGCKYIATDMSCQLQPNFLIICTDQMRADHMGCAGNPVIRTPHLDALADQGVNLSRAYVTRTSCIISGTVQSTRHYVES